ncbi:hypothetical protein ACIPL1_24830 [Pseudomonas sp. NPDC090202]|uniref:hypothetical protein n=1 Tax=Pseudomonas sp. NPDC090202 TaxID=3364476 RepID=UPI00381900E0
MTDKSREQFEAWHRGIVDGNPPHEKYDNGDYINAHVQRYWTGWHASRAALVVELPKDIKSMAGPLLYADDVRESLAAAGVAMAVKP